MNCNVFNSKVNLPKFCAKLGYSDYQYVKMPSFGWFAHNQDKSFIGNIFDVVSMKDREFLYGLICKEKPEYLDFDLAYSDLQETKIKFNMFEIQLWTSAYAFARKELETYKIMHGNKRVLIKDLLIEYGFGAAIENGVGVITNEVVKRFSMLNWPKSEIRGKLIVPTFNTPLHICSLEYCAWDTPSKLHALWQNGEKGWYGNLNHKKIVSDVTELWTTPGSTWDYKADFWAPQQPMVISDQVDVSDLLKIWSEATNTVFDKSPLLRIVDAGKTEELKNHIGNLSYQQLEEAEKVTGMKLADYWKRARETQVQIGTKVFTKRDNAYWVYKNDRLEQVTNFAIDVEKIIKKGNKFYRKGNLLFGNKSVPFEINERHFTTNYMFHRGIKDKFLTAGLGVPIVHPDFFNKALLIVDSFNAGVEIETDD